MRDAAAAALALAAALFAAQTASAKTPSPSTAVDSRWGPWIEAGGVWSSERSRAETTLWLPLWQSRAGLLFADLRGKLFEESVREGNFALGFRHMLPSGWNAGFWAGYDVRRTTTGNVFHQAAFGVEALHPVWDFRLNGYVPLSAPKAGGSLAEVQLSGSQIFMTGGLEVPLHGLDAEVGVRLPWTSPKHEFRLYGGGFWFDHKDALREIAGPKARLEWRIADALPALPGSRLTFEAGVRHDEVRNTAWEAGARLRIPLGHGSGMRLASLGPQARRMAERIERDTDIVSAPSAPEPVADAITGVAFDRVVYTADNGNSVTNASNAAGTNALVIATGTIPGAQTQQGNQTLQGGGSTIQVRGQKSGAVAGFTAPGAVATLNAPGNASNLTLAGSSTHVAGLRIQGAGAGNGANWGIDGGSNKSNVIIANTTVSDTGDDGIFFNGLNSNVTISGTTIAGAGSNGIQFNNINSNVTISDTTITNAGGDGIQFSNSNSNVTIANTTVVSPGFNGIEIFNSNNVALNNSTFAGAVGASGIRIQQFGNTLNGTGNTAAGATFGGNLCDDGGNAWTGAVVFDGTPITHPNCP